MSRSLHIKGAYLWDDGKSVQRDLYIHKGRIVESVPNDAHVVDLEGMTIFPGLINAHDHLHQNHFPRTKFRNVYNNAHEWGEDVDARLDSEPYKSLRAVPMKDRLFIGGLKNLLCGATTVAHHDYPYKEMFHRDFPVRVLKQYGYAHSLHFETDEAVIRSYQKTPKNWPWFIHLAEGTDDVAATEYQKLKALGCVGENTVLVHGVGMREEDIEDAANTVRGLVWCPSSNEYLLGVTSEDEQCPYYAWMKHSNPPSIALGSDSRLTADNDLLGDMRLAIDVDWGTRWFYQGYDTVTSYAATIFRRNDIGNLHAGSFADCIFADVSKPDPTWPDGADEYIYSARDKPSAYLTHATRSILQLVVTDGIPSIGDPDMMAKFPHIETVPIMLDGVPKAIHIDLARRIHQCSIKEPGLEVADLPTGKRFWFF